MNHTGAVVLWIGVALLAMLLVAPSTQLRVDAGQVNAAHGYTLLTAQSADPRASGGRELLYLVDHRTNMVLVYGVTRDENGTTPQLLDGGPMSVLFGTPINAVSP
jgi:hypothetical protein